MTTFFWDEEEDESSFPQHFLPMNAVSAAMVCTEAGVVTGSTPATCFLNCCLQVAQGQLFFVR